MTEPFYCRLTVLVRLSADEQGMYICLSDTISTLRMVLEQRYYSLRRPPGGKYIAELNRLRLIHPDDSDIERMLKAMRQRMRVLHLAHTKIDFIDRLASYLPASDKTIVFHEQVRYVEEVRDIFAKLAPRLRAVFTHHSHLTESARANALSRFRAELGALMLTAHTLDEGLDVADASVAILLASSGSGRQKIQRIGRVLRPTSDKARARIVILAARDTIEDPLGLHRRTDKFFDAVAEVGEPAILEWPENEREVISFLAGKDAQR